MLHEVQLIYIMIMYRVAELLFMTVGNIENIAAAKWGYLVNDIHYIFSSFMISLIFCNVEMRVGTNGKRNTFSMNPIS